MVEMLPLLGRLARAGTPARYVVVPFNNNELQPLVQQEHGGRFPAVNCLMPNAVWSCGSLLIAMPERLSKLQELALEEHWPIAAVLASDPVLRLHRDRRSVKAVTRKSALRKGDLRYLHEQICQLRYELRRGDWRPPLLLCTQQPLRSIAANSLAPHYGLETWWFVDGDSLRCGEVEEATTGG